MVLIVLRIDASVHAEATHSAWPTSRRHHLRRRVAQAFGAAVRALRTERGIAQESLANLAGIERSHMGKVERGEHMPTLAIIFKIASALECSTAVLMSRTEELLAVARS